MKKLSTRTFVLIPMLIAVLVILGYVNIPQPAGLSITFNMIPVAIAAMTIGPVGGAIVGGAFGLISFLQCFGICGFSGMGAALAGINPFLAFVQRFFPRLIDGLALGWLFRLLWNRMKLNISFCCAATGFMAAFLNTLLFMTSLVWLFGGTEYMRASMAGRGMLTYIVAAVGVNGLVEMIVSTVLSGAIGFALYKAGFIQEH
ncbi:MAG: ECF transporter S component [Clostridia bacterium]|nr:ECF transporter S component [Clostridia bacterium]